MFDDSVKNWRANMCLIHIIEIDLNFTKNSFIQTVKSYQFKCQHKF